MLFHRPKTPPPAAELSTRVPCSAEEVVEQHRSIIQTLVNRDPTRWSSTANVNVDGVGPHRVVFVGRRVALIPIDSMHKFGPITQHEH